MSNTIFDLSKITKQYFLHIGCIFLCTFLFLGMVYGSSSSQNTTIRLNLITDFTGDILPIGNTNTFIPPVYWTTWANQILSFNIITDSSFIISWDLQSLITWITTRWTITTIPILLTPQDWLKNITADFTNIVSDMLYTQVTFWLDTTPPPLSVSYSWPNPTHPYTAPISFTWNASVDTGIWLESYVIQISNTMSFTTAIEFTTTQTNLVLWWWSLSSGKRYRRRWAYDKLDNRTYGYPIVFTIQEQSPSNPVSVWSASSTKTPSPISDQCPARDNSWNYFDGICSPITQQPVLVNVPWEHQVADTEPRREKALHKINNTNVMIYNFPDYEAPKSLTIYEHDPKYVYKDIYERGEKTTNLINWYNPWLWKQKESPKSWLHDNIVAGSFTSKLNWVNTSRSTNYLFYRYINTTNSCADIWQFCPIDPTCRDT